MASEIIPHLALPIQMAGKGLAVRDQDSDAEVADCVKVIMSFSRGDRAEDLDFGIDDPTFQTQPIDTADIETAIADYEPRADVEVNTVDLPDGSTTVEIKLTQPTSDDTMMEG